GVRGAVHLEERDGPPGDDDGGPETRALGGGLQLGRAARLLERLGLLAGRQRDQDEVVHPDLGADHLGVVVEPDEAPLRVPRLGVGQAQPDRHQERVGDEDGEVEDRGDDQHVAQRRFPFEEWQPGNHRRRALGWRLSRRRRCGEGGQSATSVCRSKRWTCAVSNRSETGWPGFRSPVSSVSIWRSPAGQRAVTMASLPRGSTTSIVAGTLTRVPFPSPPSWMCSGRMPMVTCRPLTPLRRGRGTGSVRSPPRTTASAAPSPRSSPSKKFIGGVPMNPATKRLAGWRYASSGV